MTLEELERLAQNFRDRAGDNEAGHIAEDELWEAALRFIANETLDIADVKSAARIALSTLDHDFQRWYA